MKELICLVILFAVSAFFVSCSNAEEKKEQSPTLMQTTREGIEAGRKLSMEKFSFCHDAQSTKTVVGPGLLGILQNPELPVSKKPATPENIRNQLKNPYQNMTSFAYLADSDITNIIMYLSTL
jgi:cytochrome c2